MEFLSFFLNELLKRNKEVNLDFDFEAKENSELGGRDFEKKILEST